MAGEADLDGGDLHIGHQDRYVAHPNVGEEHDLEVVLLNRGEIQYPVFDSDAANFIEDGMIAITTMQANEGQMVVCLERLNAFEIRPVNRGSAGPKTADDDDFFPVWFVSNGRKRQECFTGRAIDDRLNDLIEVVAGVGGAEVGFLDLFVDFQLWVLEPKVFA